MSAKYQQHPMEVKALAQIAANRAERETVDKAWLRWLAWRGQEENRTLTPAEAFRAGWVEHKDEMKRAAQRGEGGEKKPTMEAGGAQDGGPAMEAVSQPFEEALGMARWEVEHAPIPENSTGVTRRMKLEQLDSAIDGFRRRLRSLPLSEGPAPGGQGAETGKRWYIQMVVGSAPPRFSVKDAEGQDYPKNCGVIVEAPPLVSEGPKGQEGAGA